MAESNAAEPSPGTRPGPPGGAAGGLLYRACRRVRESLLLQAAAVLLLLYAIQVPAILALHVSQVRALASGADAERAERVVVDAGRVSFGMAVQKVGVDSYLATADPAYLDDYVRGVEDVYNASRRLDRDVAGSRLQAGLAALVATMNGWMTWARDRRLEVDASHRPVTGPAIVRRGDQLFDAFRAEEDSFGGAVAARAAALRAEADRLHQQQVWVTIIGALTGVSILVVAGVAFLALALRPVARLAAVARRLAQGREQVVPYARRRDEVGALARSLAAWQMAQASRRAIVEHLPIGLFILDPEARVETVNPEGVRMTGYTPEEWRRMTVEDLARLPADAAGAAASAGLYARLLAGEVDDATVEQRLRRKDGTEFWGSMTLTAVREPGSRAGYLVGMVLDVTERKEELERAARVQRELLPERAPEVEGYELAGTCTPAAEVGGDFFDWYRDGPGTLTITIGDVMGKGLSGAILMAAVRTALRAASGLPTVAGSVQSAASSIARNLESAGAFVTLFHARVDLGSGRVTCVDAGHGLVLLRRRDGRVTMLEVERGLPLGALPGEVYVESAFTLEPGEALVAFSDGVLEVDPEITSAGHAAALLAPAATARAMADSLVAGAPAGHLADDLTVVALRRQPVTVESGPRAKEPCALPAR